LLAERAALAAEGGFEEWPYGGRTQAGATDPRAATGVQPYPGQATAIVPASGQDFGKDPSGGQS